MNKDPYLSLNDDEFNKLSGIYKLFSSNTRLKIVFLLGQSEMSVGDICKAIDLTSSAVSHQLKELKQSKIVKFRREAQTVYYSLDNQNIMKILSAGTEYIKGSLQNENTIC